MRTRPHRLIVFLPLLLAVVAAQPSGAASITVQVRDGDGRTLGNEIVHLKAISTGGDHRTRYRLRRQGLFRPTGPGGRVRFDDLTPGTYLLDVPRPRQPSLLPPADNPLAPAPRITLFRESEHLETEIELARGFPATALIELPGDDHDGFRAVFRHRESGRVLASPFPRDANFVERLLAPGVWELEVAPRPGYLLVSVERERVPLPGHTVTLDLVHEPGGTFVTWTYAAPSRLAGVVVEASGRTPAVRVEAALLEAGPWHEAARRRGGSLFERVTAGVDPHDGTYEMVLPDGVWEVRPAGPQLLASEPESVEVALSPGMTGRADFTVRLDERAGGRPFVVEVHDAGHDDVTGAAVEVYALDDLETPLRSGVTGRFGFVGLPGLPEGSYLVVAGHEDHLEGRSEVRDYDPRAPAARRRVKVVLPKGAEVRLEATDPEGAPLAEVKLTVERLGALPETVIRAEDFLATKRGRSAETDASGRTAVRGLYSGAYRVRARLGGRLAARGLILLGAQGGELARELEIELPSRGVFELEARMVPASSLRATLTCADAWTLPDAASARVVDAGGRDPDFDGDAADGEAEPGGPALLALDGVPLTGRGRDVLEIGPLEQGVYRLAVQPAGFDRWTWAFEAHDFAAAAPIQVGAPDGEAAGTVDLGPLQIECGPAVDLLPAVASGEAFPALHQVAVAARVLDPEAEKETAPRPSIARRGGRILLRGLPRGPSRLEVVLAHPHFLPEPELRWLVAIELERGIFREIVPEVEALGGAITIVADGGSAAVFGPAGELRQADVRGGETLLPSLPPGRYRVELYGEAGGEPLRAWSDVDVRAAETVRLDPR